MPGKTQTARLELKWGKLRLTSLGFETPKDKAPQSVTVTVAGRQIKATLQSQPGRTTLTLAEPVVAAEGQAIEVKIVLG